MQITAIGTVAVTIVLLGVFLFARTTLTGLGEQLLGQFEVAVYFNNDASPKQITAVENTLKADERVASVTFVSKKQGLAELRDQTKGVIDTSILTENPLPDKLRVKAKNAEMVAAIASSVQKAPGVANVLYGEAAVQRLLELGSVLRTVGIAFIIVFLLVAGIIISNTIRLTVFARRREIAIMQLVGATNTYIRMPFICEGLLDGFVGALIALVVLAVAKAVVWPHFVDSLSWMSLKFTDANGSALALQLLLVGGLVGAIASWISVGRYLRT